MGEENQAVPFVDIITKLLTLVSLGIAIFAAWIALPVDENIKNLQAQAQALDIALRKADFDLKGLESSRKITLELYHEVKSVIAKKDKSPQEEEAVRFLVQSLAEDPLRWKLLEVLAVGGSSLKEKQAAATTSKFYEDEATEQPQLAIAANLKAAASANFGSYNIDFFYCEKMHLTSEPLARAALRLKGSGDAGRWRVRALPESVNQLPSYSISTSEIRFTPPEETAVANALAQSLAKNGIQVALHETPYQTPGYVSVFVCQ